MKKYFLLTFVFMNVYLGVAQNNLIRNGDFETWCGISCEPVYVQQATPPHDYSIDEIQDWHSTWYNASGSYYLLSSDQCYNQSPGQFNPGLCNSRNNSLGAAGLALNGNGNGYPFRHEFIVGETENLVANQEYHFEFWIMFDLASDIKIGAYFDRNFRDQLWNPVNGSLMGNYNPQIEKIFLASDITVGQWQRVHGCFKPIQSGEYFVHIGSFSPVYSTTIYANIDDVSLSTASTSMNPIMSSFLLDNTVYCQNVPILFSDDGSNNYDSYRIVISEQINSSTSYDYIFNSGIQTGTVPSGYDLSQLLISNSIYLHTGVCYKVELEVFNQYCSDISEQVFCIEAPANLVTSGNENPICEGQPLTLSVNGISGGTFNWSNNNSQSNTAVYNPTYNGGQPVTYSCNITSSSGCQYSIPFDVVVHSNNNTPPVFTAPSNNTILLEPGDQIIIDIQTNDNLEEEVTITFPQTPNWIEYSSTNGPFGWYNQTNFYDDGNGVFSGNSYSVTALSIVSGYVEIPVRIDDNNVCGSLSDLKTITIEVVCPNCDLCVSYEGNLPNNNPLPPLTKARSCIKAGLSQPVETGNDQIIFRAGEYIEMGPYFKSGNDFITEINPNICTPENCASCCDVMLGFDFDPDDIPNVLTPNGDEINDIWYIYDLEDPSCMFNADTWSLVILNRWGTDVIHTSGFGLNYCCPFNGTGVYSDVIAEEHILKSELDNNMIPNWDGTVNYGNGIGSLVSDGVYTYIFYIERCGQWESYQGTIQVLSGSNLVVNNQGEVPVFSREDQFEIVHSIESDSTSSNENLSIDLFPNPSTDIIKYNFVSTRYELDRINIYSSKGDLVSVISSPFNGQFNVSNFESGTYFVNFITRSGKIYNKKIQKK